MIVAPAISLVVATCNNPELLARLLRSLSVQTCDDFEVLVADQSDPVHQPTVEALCRQMPGRGGIYRHLKRKGLSRARNAILGDARGRFISFPDDDCWYPPGAVAAVLDAFKTQGEASFICGSYSDANGVVNPMFRAPPGPLHGKDAFSRISSNTIFVRAAEARATMFDDRLGVGGPVPAGEDVDFILALLARGAKGVFLPSLEVHHPVHMGVDARRLSYETANVPVRRRYAYLFPILTARFVLGTIKLAISGVFRRSSRRLLMARVRGMRTNGWIRRNEHAPETAWV